MIPQPKSDSPQGKLLQKLFPGLQKSKDFEFSNQDLSGLQKLKDFNDGSGLEKPNGLQKQFNVNDLSGLQKIKQLNDLHAPTTTANEEHLKAQIQVNQLT